MPPAVTVGRFADMDLQLDPAAELEVSRRHAVFELKDGVWMVSDLGSRNGTFLNGSRIAAYARLRSGDQVQFGAGGPVVEVTIGASPGETPVSGKSRSGGRLDTGEIRLRVARATRPLRWAVLVLAALVLGLSAFYVVSLRNGQRAREAESRSLRAQIDSILSESRRVQSETVGRAAGLAEALAASEAELRALRQRLAGRPENDDDLEALRRDLLGAQTALMRQQLAATTDYSAIEAANRPAVAKLYVEFSGGQRFTGRRLRRGADRSVGHQPTPGAPGSRPRRHTYRRAVRRVPPGVPRPRRGPGVGR